MAAYLLDNLISYWKLDEASGNAVDAHGGHTLTDNNTVGTGTGKLNGCRDLDSSQSEYLSRASGTENQIGDIEAEWSIWVRPETLTGFPMVFSKDNNASSREYYLFYNSTSGYFVWAVTGNGSTETALNFTSGATGVTVSTGNWYHLLVWHDPATNQIGGRINLSSTITASHSTGIYSGSTEFRLGARAAAGSLLPFNGDLDEFGFWKRRLNSDEETALYGSGTPPGYASFTSSSGATVAKRLVNNGLVNAGLTRGRLAA